MYQFMIAFQLKQQKAFYCCSRDVHCCQPRTRASAFGGEVSVRRVSPPAPFVEVCSAVLHTRAFNTFFIAFTKHRLA